MTHLSKKVSGPGSELSTKEARVIVEEIKEHLESARALLFKLYVGQGWLALGYDSWRQCVLGEFGRSESQLYRELSAARIEDRAGLPIGSLPESHIRAVREIYQDDVESANAVMEAWMDGAETAEEFASHAARGWVLSNIPQTLIAKRMNAGEIGHRKAYRLGVDYCNAHPDAKPIIESCVDPDLSNRLLLLFFARRDLWDEIASTKSIPLYENVALDRANIRDLEAWMGVDNAERRAQIVEENRDYYDKRTRLVEELFGASLLLASTAMKYGDLVDDAKRVMDLLKRIKELKETKL